MASALRTSVLGAVGGWFAAMVGACIIDDLDYSTKNCPDGKCPDGYYCVSQRCQRTRPEGGVDCTPAISIEGFSLDWAAPNALRWKWSPVGDGARFVRYELDVGLGDPTQADLTKPLVRYLPETSAELGRFELRHTSSEKDFVRATTAFDLVPATSYWSRLLVTDNAGCTYATPPIAGRTEDDPTHAVTLFHDAINGYVTCDSAGSTAELDPLASAALGDAGASIRLLPSSGCTLKLGDLPGDISAMSKTEIKQTAILELWLAIAQTSIDWSTIWFRQGADSGLYALQPYTLTAKVGYRRIQLPFRVLRDDFDAAPSDPLRVIDQLDIGAAWAPGDQIHVDEVRIRW